MCRHSIILDRCETLLLVALAWCAPAASFGQASQEDFDRDPGWEGYRHRLLPSPLPVARQDFGFRASRHAGGKAAGEIGGWVQRSVRPATYAKPIATRTLNDRLTASGTFAVTRCGNGSGVMFGWFHDSSRGWRTPNSLGFRLDGNGGKYWMLFEYGTRNWLTGGGATFEGRYQTTRSKPLAADGAVHRWRLDYEPDANQGLGKLTFTLDGVAHPVDLPPGHRDDGAEFNRFGIWNVQMSGDGMDVWFDDLVIDGVTEGFDRDPGWIGVDNAGIFPQRFVRPHHDFGFSRTSHAGGKEGEIGGIVWRDTRGTYYGNRVGRFSLDDELSASGRIVMTAAASDSAYCFGWFDSQSRRADEPSPRAGKRGVPRSKKNVLGIIVEGPSRAGHYFRPEYATAAGAVGLADHGPVIRPDGKPHRWSFHYDPKGAGGQGRITWQLDEIRQTFDLHRDHRRQGATFDRFGILGMQGADGHFVEAYLDDLTYSARKRQ